ncbi:MAG: hypothetical protein ABFS42_10935 [Candidatus Krumholzibacteriota bacterium]
MIRNLVLIAFIVLTGTAIAQDQDVVGIYFDEEGLTSTVQTTQSPEDVIAWVILKNISSQSGLSGFAMKGFWTLPYEGPCGDNLLGPQLGICNIEWIFGAEPPVPQAEILPVVRFQVHVLAPTERVDLFIQPLDYPPLNYGDAVYEANDGSPGTIIPLHPTSGSYDLPVAVINGGEVAVKSAHWGAVKSMYR